VSAISEDKVIILAEVDEGSGLSRLSRELVGVAARLASETGAILEAIVLGSGIEAAARELISLGVRKVFTADHPSLAEYNPDTYQAVLEDQLRESGPLTLLAGHTSLAQDLLPRVAAAFGAGLVTDCVGVETAGGNPVFIKPVFGGNAVARLDVTTPLRMATVRARVSAAPEAATSAEGEVISLEPRGVEPRVRVMESVKEQGSVRLETAGVVVAGGRGIGGGDGFDRLGELADLLGGAVGASRPPCDSGWMPSTSQVGITGKIVAPDLYVAVAISGSSQHLSGMSESVKIVAVNQDADAYIFKVADYGVAGDWKQVIPAVTESLRKHLSS